MKRLVLDASVALKWSVPAAGEALCAESVMLLQHYVNGDLNFIVPDIFWAETGNVLRKGVRLRRWSRSTADKIASELQSRNFFTVSSLTLIGDALRLAHRYERAVCDCIYIALAIQSKSEMITADERLANAVASYLPVKWLGAF